MTEPSPADPGATTHARTGTPAPVPRTARERWQITVFGIGVVLLPVGLGMLFVPQKQCEPNADPDKPDVCSTREVRTQGAIIAGVGFTGVWVGRMPLAARRKSSAWDRSWR